MSDPVVVIGHLEDLTSRLEEASREIYRTQKAFDDLDDTFAELFDDALVQMTNLYESAGKRLPGEEVRRAFITRQIKETHPELYENHRELSRELRRNRARADSIEAQIRSNQSILSYLKTEVQAT